MTTDLETRKRLVVAGPITGTQYDANICHEFTGATQPGGVDAEQMNTPGSGVAYGDSAETGRANNCRQSSTPPVMSSPT